MPNMLNIESTESPQSVSIREAASITGMSKEYFYKLIREQAILYYKFGRSVRIPLKAINSLRVQVEPIK